MGVCMMDEMLTYQECVNKWFDMKGDLRSERSRPFAIFIAKHFDHGLPKDRIIEAAHAQYCNKQLSTIKRRVDQVERLKRMYERELEPELANALRALVQRYGRVKVERTLELLR